MKLPSPFPVPFCSPFPVPRSPFPSHKGSALLIVLGMVSFMVISSVAFSMYMRTSRQPSNFLRRNASSRYLLKSALACAIERLDGVWRCAADIGVGDSTSSGYVEGVYDDPYPGVGPGAYASGDYAQCGNRWVRHVFSPFADVQPKLIESSADRTTVSTVTLEGLAYLPPAFINDVRIQARRTLTARWCNLSYEFGRYAFCAVDVSDCFDVNKLRANAARTSASRQRIGLSTLFAKEDSGLSSFDAQPMSTFDAGVNGVGQIPLVSMADFNLVFGRSDFTPFCKYVGQSGNTAILGRGDTIAANALFTTDTWFPPTNAVTAVKRYNLEATQPFSEFGEDDSFNAKDVLNSANATLLGKELIRHLGGVGTIALYDYLDADNIPTSYALPTVETAPMVCALGVEPQGGLKTRVVADAGKARTATYPSGVVDPDTKKEYDNKVVATPYMLDLGTSALMVQGQMVFPFKRLKGKGYGLGFKAEGLVRVFFAPAALRSRVEPNSPLLAPDAWEDGEKDGIVTRKFEDSLTWSDDICAQEETIRPFQKPVSVETQQQLMFWKIEKYVVDNKGNLPAKPTKTWYSLDGVAKAADRALFYDEKGKKAEALDKKAAAAKDKIFEPGSHSDWRNATDNDIATQTAADGQEIDATKFVPHVAVWMKVSNADGDYADKVVDVVPAYQKDDEVWGKRGDPAMGELATVCAADAPPILRFSGKTEFPYGIGAEKATGENDGKLAWSVLYTVDPRFNYAPEAWYSASVEPAELKNNRELWIKTLDGVFGSKVNDRDIFMFTSDQEYLQSMGELQFLPALRNLAEAPSGRVVEDVAHWKPEANSPKTSVSEVLDFMPGMLETYSAPEGDPVYNLGDPAIEVVSSSGDFRVNPFTPDDRIFRAAIANTPYDWFVASTNDDLNPLLGGKVQYLSSAPKPSATAMLGYTFSSQSQCTSAKWRDRADDNDSVFDIADKLHNLFRDEGMKGRAWESIYDGAAWFNGTCDNQTDFLGVKLEKPLHGVDRKFLHGFWRECFQNRQQLFLVFLRAEPLTVGGSGTASMANAQTGARGVALVWRDPAPPAMSGDTRPGRGVTAMNSWKVNSRNGSRVQPAPHRTRVLFYHMFD